MVVLWPLGEVLNCEYAQVIAEVKHDAVVRTTQAASATGLGRIHQRLGATGVGLVSAKSGNPIGTMVTGC